MLTKRGTIGVYVVSCFQKLNECSVLSYSMEKLDPSGTKNLSESLLMTINVLMPLYMKDSMTYLYSDT